MHVVYRPAIVGESIHGPSAEGVLACLNYVILCIASISWPRNRELHMRAIINNQECSIQTLFCIERRLELSLTVEIVKRTTCSICVERDHVAVGVAEATEHDS